MSHAQTCLKKLYRELKIFVYIVFTKYGDFLVLFLQFIRSGLHFEYYRDCRFVNVTLRLRLEPPLWSLTGRYRGS